jgi:hypothetical protein
MIKTLAFKTIAEMGVEDNPAESREIAYLAKAIKDLAGADKLSLDREERIRDAALAAAAKKVDSVVKTRGLTAEDAAAIRAQILGVGDGRG